MANTFEFNDILSNEVQEIFFKENLSETFANYEGASKLSSGSKFSKILQTISADFVPNTISRTGAIAATALNETQEELTVNKQFGVRFEVHDFDAIQSNYGVIASYGEMYGRLMKNQMDADYFGEVINSSSTVDDGSIGGTAGNSISLTGATDNVLKVVAAVREALVLKNVMDTNLMGAITPAFQTALTKYGAGKDTSMGDDVTRRGFYGKFDGFDLYTTNNLTGSAVIDLSTNPSNGHTLTIQGVVFTFVSSIGTTAGNVLIGANAAATIVNLLALIAAPSTTTSTGVALTGQSLNLIQSRVSASAASTNVTVIVKGAGYVSISASNATVSKKTNHCLFQAGKGAHMIVQKRPSVKVVDATDNFIKNVMIGSLYGVKTFTEDATRMVNVKIAA